MKGLDTRKKEIAASKETSPLEQWDFNWDGDDFKIAETNKLVIYQMYMETFFGEKSSDGENFADVDKKLAYLKLLGINAMELIKEPSLPDIDYDQGICRSKAFANFVKKAHIHDIAVVMVVDFLHFGSGDMDPWKFYGWPENDKQDFFYGDNLRNPFGSPIPNFDRSEVRRFIRDYVFMWLEKYHCDGIRVKATNLIRHISGANGEEFDLENGLWLLKEINGEIQTKYPDKILIAEDIGEKNFITESLVSGGLGFDIQWDSLFLQNIRFVLKQARDEDRIIQCIVDALTHMFGNDPFSRMVYCESDSEINKGAARLPEEIHPGRADSPYAIKRSILGAVLTLTAPGIPLLFQGQEFMTPTFFSQEERPDWDKLTHLNGIQQLFGDLIKLRKSDYKDYAGLQGDRLDFIHFNQQAKILGYQRSHQDYSNHRVLVIINLSNLDYKKYIIGLPAKGRWKLVFNSNSREYGDFGSSLSIKDFIAKNKPYDGHPYRGSFTLPCYGALIFIHYASGSIDE